jgi:GT2 family glycosyltransferase/glycosyltransferase involved in cell wall biosynthesis
VPQDQSPTTETESPAEVGYALKRTRAAIAAADLSEAARWADRARRLAPESTIVAELQGRLALKAGDDEAALLHLEAALRPHASPDLTALALETLVRLERVGEAARRLEDALARFAVTPDGPLSGAARTCARATGAPGWTGLAPDLSVVGETRTVEGAQALEIDWAGTRLRQTIRAGVWPDEGGGAFQARGGPPTAGRLLVRLNGMQLLGSGLPVPPDLLLDGRILLRDGRLEGWVRLGWIPTLEPRLRVRIDDGPGQPLSLAPDPAGLERWRFTLDLRPLRTEAEAVVEAEAPDGAWTEVPGSPARGAPPPAPKGLPRRPANRVPWPRSAARTLVVVPVYRGEAETLACIKSVRASAEAEAEIVVVDDASPEPGLKAALQDLGRRRAVTLLVNERNLGYAASVNRALEAHKGRDVVLLNADALVYPGWLERLRRAAYAAPDVGTATPLSNAGALASYPKGLSTPCGVAEGAALSRLAARVNAGLVVEAPTGVGHCLFIREDCRAAVGALDAACFGRGYGEETDFCLRASALGWRHLIAADVFVRHEGAVSFGQAREALVTRNEALLAARHPAFAADLEAFVSKDPLAAARRRLDQARLLERSRPLTVLIDHAGGGGVARQVAERQMDLTQKGHDVLLMRPEGGKTRLLAEDLGLKDLLYDPETEAEAFVELIRALRPVALEVHHAAGHEADLLRRILGEGLEVSVYVHDYSWFCPRITLLDGSGRYCGEPDVSACEVCVARNGSETGETSVARLRARSADLLKSARRVIAPSADAAQRIARQFSGVRPQVQPLERRGYLPTRRRAAKGPIKVLVLGAIGDSKGYQVLEAAARDARDRALELAFVVVGFSRDDHALLSLGNVFVTGPYAEDEALALIAREAPDVALFASVWPETWLYALTHALRARLPVAAFDLGAQAERLRAAKTVCELLPSGTPAAAVNDALVRLARRPASRRLERFSASPALPAPVDQAPPRPPASAPPEPSSDTTPDPRSQEPAPSSAAPNPPDPAAMPQDPLGLTASAQVLTLATGIYRFSVSAGGHDRRQDRRISLPALQIAVAPGAAGGDVEFMTGLGADGAWLFDAGDVLIAKVKAAGTPLLVTSYSLEGLRPLAIAVERIDEPAAKSAPAAAPSPPRQRPLRAPAAPPQRLLGGGRAPLSDDGRRILRTRVLAHISRRGDVEFQDEDWIGGAGLKLPIEGFAINPLEGLEPLEIEYKAVSEKGIETPWTPGGELCGTRRLGLALAGFAVRVRGAAARRVECRYSGAFRSGAVVGPASNGAPLRSGSLEDVLTGVQLRFLSLEPAAEAPAPEPVPAAAARLEGRPVRPQGPRFSVFREEPSPTDQ